MPGSTRPATRVEAIYNVTTDFPDLGLHTAAITGNVGLAHYALTHGQPENSVLHGLLPLHAACSGGNEQIVSMLIERGADVNAPRLPRRYSNEGRKMPTVGVSGSGPLHFAAANGHLSICRLLLAKGALPDKRDKHGLTPEDLALANGHLEIVATLRAFQTLRASLQERLNEDDDDSAVTEEDEEVRRLPPLRSSAGQVGTGHGKAGGMMRGLGSFATRGRRSSSSAAQKPSSSSLSALNLNRASSLNRKLSRGRANGELSTIRTASKLSLSSDRSDSALSLTSPIDGPSSSRRLVTDAPPVPLPAHLTTQGRHRRPSLPSIIEKAAHQIAHPRSHAMHDNHSSRTRSSFASSDTHSIDSRSIASSRFTSTSNRSLLKIFSRHRNGEEEHFSPESASPSPPRSTSALQLDDEDIGRTIDSFRRMSFDVNPSSKRLSLDGGASRPLPPSAPAQRTDFFLPSPSFPHPQSARLPLQRSFSQSSEPTSSDAADYSGRPGGSLWSIGARGGERSPLIQDWSTDVQQPRRRASGDGREDEWSSSSKGKGRATSSSMEDPRYLSSNSADNDPAYSPVSPNDSSPQLRSSRAPWTSNSSSPYTTETEDASTAASTRRPGSQQSSNLSSLRRVASANLRRSSGDPYSPVSSYGDLGYGGHPQLSDDREQGTSGWNMRGIDPGPRRGFAGSGVRPIGRARGASINSTLSSAFSVSPQLQTHLSEDEDEGSAGGGSSDFVPPAIFVSSTSPPHGRSRALSGSSSHSNQSSRGPPSGGSGASGSSYTAPSFLSSGAPSASSGPAVPSVPEDATSSLLVRSLSQGQAPSPSRTPPPLKHRISSYAEAKDLVRQAEKDLLDLPSKRASTAGGSTVSLAAQLAAYGERLAIEREFAQTSHPEPALATEQPAAGTAAPAEAEDVARRSSAEGSTVTHSTVTHAKNDSSGKNVKQRSSSESVESSKSRGLKLPHLMGFQKHVQERASQRAATPGPSAFSPPSLDLGPVPQAPPAGAHYLTSITTIPDVAKVYQDRAEALRRRGQKVASALGSPLTSPVSPSVRRGSQPPASVTADQSKVWIISGQPPTVVKTKPTHDVSSSPQSTIKPLPAVAGKEDVGSIRSSSSTSRKHSLDGHLPTPSPTNKAAAARLVPPINLTASPLRSSSPLASSRGASSVASSSGKVKQKPSPDTSPRHSKDTLPANSRSSSSQYKILRSSVDANSSSAPSSSTANRDGPVGLGLGPIGASSMSSTPRDDSSLDAYGTKRKTSASSWGSRLLHGISRKG